jgi:competence protein ComEC
MVNPNRLFPLSFLTAGAAFAYYGVYLLNIRFSILVFVGAIAWSFFLALNSPLSLPARTWRHCRVLALAFAAGLILGAAVASRIPAVHLGLPTEQVSALEGSLLEDPRSLSGGNGMAAVQLSRTFARNVRASAGGKVTVIFPEGRLEDLKEFGRKSTVYLEGRFLAPSGPGPGLFRAAGVHVVSPAPPLEQFRTGLRRNLVARLSRPSNKTWGSLSLALLLGIRDNLDSGFASSYRDAGVSHVLALSGMHLAVFSALIALLFKPLLGPKGAAVAGALLIITYVFLVGSQPSLDRAAIMYLLGALAIFGSFARNPSSLLNLAFLIQIIRQPESGIAISFVLSYLALWGILHTGLEIGELFRGRVPQALLQPLAASLGAFIATASVSAASFAVLKPAGIVSGLLIVPITTFFMILSIGYVALDLALPFLARPLGMLLSLLYGVLEHLVGLSARLPGLNFGGTTGVHWMAVLFVSVLLAGLVSLFARRRVPIRSFQ